MIDAGPEAGTNCRYGGPLVFRTIRVEVFAFGAVRYGTQEVGAGRGYLGGDKYGVVELALFAGNAPFELADQFATRVGECVDPGVELNRDR